MSATITVRLDDYLCEKMAKLASVTERSRSYLAAQAIADYVRLQEWQLVEIQSGIADADAGRTISHASMVKRWGKNSADHLDTKSRGKSRKH